MISSPFIKRVFFWFFLTIAVFPVIAQVTVKALVSTDRIVVNEPFELIFRTENGSAENIQLPSVAGINISKRTGTYSSFSMLGGKSSGFEEITYAVTAQKPGNYTIPPVKITIKGKDYLTNRIQISVTATPKLKPMEAEGDVFFKAALSDNPIYLGQQVILQYDIYTNKNVINANFTKKPGFQHIFSKVLNIRHTGRNVVIAKKQYYTQTIETFVLYAQKTGVLPLEKAEIEYKYEKAANQNPFFNEIIVKTLLTNALNLEVLPLPDQNVPHTFSGGVGTFTFSSSADKQTITTDDVLRLVMTIRGDGDPKFWKAPAWEPIDGVEFYDPNLISEKTEVENGREFTTRVYEYLIQITKPEDVVLHPKFSYFDPKQKSYIELKDKPVLVKVLTAKSISKTGNENTLSSAEKPSEKGGLNLFPYLTTALLLGFITLLLFIFRKKFKPVKTPDMDEKRSLTSVEDLVNFHLAEAAKYERHEDHKAFFNEILKALSHFLKDNLNEGKEWSDKKVVLARLQEKAVPMTVINEIDRLVNTCELAVFAGQKPDMQGVIQTTKSILHALEKLS